MKSTRFRVFRVPVLWVLLFASGSYAIEIPKFAIPANPIEISQPVRRGKYIDSAGRRAVLMGREEGLFEAWVYPMKIVHDLRLTFTVEGYSYPLDAADLAEWITVRPESTTIVYSHPAFVARAHLFTPLEEPGSLILLDVDSNRKVSITVSFLIDLVPMWPAGLGGQYSYWDEDTRAFVLSESTRKHSAFVGSPAATRYSAQPAHNLPDSPTQFHIDVDTDYARRNFVPIAVAAGLDAPEKIRQIYEGLLTRAQPLYWERVEHFAHLRTDFMNLKSPEPDLDRAVEWAKVALDTGFVCNPQLGCGQVAGLGLSGTSARPGFGWFFGGDTFINSFAVSSVGDFATLRRELAFLRGNQRADGKMMHELSQAGGMIPWFTAYPYGYYHGDTTPLYIVAVENYFLHSGDVDFVRESWDSLKKAYQYCLSADSDGDGLMENAKAGLAAVETGALLNRKLNDVYLAGVSAAAHGALSHLAGALGDNSLGNAAGGRFRNACESLNRRFWNREERLLSFAVDEQGVRSNEITIWPAVPMALQVIEPEHAAAMADRLSAGAVSSDWGGRMLTNASKVYDPISYNNGSVWPFLTGLLGWADYRSHRAAAGFSRWSQNARLTYVNALGFVPELLSGDFYQAMDTAVPHQLFSSSGVITPLVKGLFGFYPDASARRIRLEPHLPARWSGAEVHNLQAGSGGLSLGVQRTDKTAEFRVSSSNLAGFALDFSPGFEPGAVVQRVVVNGKPLACRQEAAPDTHCAVSVALSGDDDIRYELRPGLRVMEPIERPSPGERTSALKIIRLQHEPANDSYTLDVEGRSGRTYSLQLALPRQSASVEGASLQGDTLNISFPDSPRDYIPARIVIR